MRIIFEKKRRKRRKIEAAKLFIGGVMVIYFGAAVFGAVVTWNYPENLPALFTFVGTPTTAALAFYCWKAKAENVKKMELNPEFLKEDGETVTNEEVQG
ncbi:MAG: hypothetical protein ACI4KR_12155 [Ruminiclostridium sp.]